MTSTNALQAASGIVGAVATANMAWCIVCAPDVAGSIVCPASAANMTRSIICTASAYCTCVLIFFSDAARMTDAMLRAMTPVVTSGIISAPAPALSRRAVTGRGTAAAAGAAT